MSKLPYGYKYFNFVSNKLGVSFDILNTILPENENIINIEKLKELCKIPRMSTFANGVIINKFVNDMPEDQAYVNVGVWQGFSFLAGLINNNNKKCIGIDNFSEFGGPRTEFLRRFNVLKSEIHSFYDMDYKFFFKKKCHDPIGVYFYDGAHDYNNQMTGLKIAEPFFAENAIILIDDTNWSEPYNATLDFINERKDLYEIIFDVKTAFPGHPTFWNGLMILRKK